MEFLLYTILVCNLLKMKESKRKFEQSSNNKLPRFLDNVLDMRESSMKNATRYCCKLSAAGRWDLTVISQSIAGGLHVQSLLRSNFACGRIVFNAVQVSSEHYFCISRALT